MEYVGQTAEIEPHTSEGSVDIASKTEINSTAAHDIHPHAATSFVNSDETQIGSTNVVASRDNGNTPNSSAVVAKLKRTLTQDLKLDFKRKQLEEERKQFDKEKKEFEAFAAKEKKLFEAKRKALDDERKNFLVAFDKDRKAFEEEKRKLLDSISKDKKTLEELVAKEKKQLEEDRKKLQENFLKDKKQLEKDVDAFKKSCMKEKKQLEEERKAIEKDKNKLKLDKKKEEEKKLKKAKKKKDRDGGSDLVLSEPQGFVQKTHVDADYQWSGSNPTEMFELEEQLGKGAFGAVFKARHKESGFVMAAKIIPLDSDFDEIEKEIEILKKCRSSNIVSYFGTCSSRDTSQLWILMDYCAGGSIRAVIETCNKPLTTAEIAYVCQCTLKGLAYLHSTSIIHRDVKAANILLTEDRQVKLADFGVSAQLTNKATLKDTIGTPLWMAPEVILNKQYDNKCDIWSLGITTIEMADGLPPHSTMNPMRAMRMIPHWPPPTLAQPDKWDHEIKEFIEQCLVKDATGRSTAIHLLMHPFIQSSPGSEVLTDSIREFMTLRKKSKRKEFPSKGSGDGSVSKGSSKEYSGSDKNFSSGLDSEGGFGTIVLKDEEEHAEEFLKDVHVEEDLFNVGGGTSFGETMVIKEVAQNEGVIDESDGAGRPDQQEDNVVTREPVLTKEDLDQQIQSLHEYLAYKQSNMETKLLSWNERIFGELEHVKNQVSEMATLLNSKPQIDQSRTEKSCQTILSNVSLSKGIGEMDGLQSSVAPIYTPVRLPTRRVMVIKKRLVKQHSTSSL